MRLYLLAWVVAFVWIACEPKPYRDGAAIYQQRCANCHQPDGKGLGVLIPPLAGADYLRTQRTQLPCVLKNGLQGPIVVNGQQYEGQQMPAAADLSAIDITNVLNYVQHTWGNPQDVYKLGEVQALLQQCANPK